MHQGVPLHRLINIHCRHGRDIETGQPHINNYSDLEFAAIIFKLNSQPITVRFVSDDVMPLDRVLVAGCQNDLDLVFPVRPLIQQFLIQLNSDPSGHADDHCFSGQNVLSVFIVSDDVIGQHFHTLIGADQGLKARKVRLGLFDNLLGCITGQLSILVIDPLQCRLVQLQFCCPVLVIYRHSRTIVHSLRHVVNINVVTEDRDRRLLFEINRRTGEANERSVGEGGSHVFCHACFPFAGITVELFIQTILRAVSLICEEDDVPAFIDHFITVAKLLDCGKDDTTSLHIQQFAQVFTAFCVFRCLAEQQLGAGRESVIKLVIQVVTVR